MHPVHPTVEDRLKMRAYARATGDVSLERACNADLARYGYLETARADDTGVERAVPGGASRGRPKLPRCEHGRIVGRCVDCEELD